jgi:glycosyltransferase involved in cell wall biosynthesis
MSLDPIDVIVPYYGDRGRLEETVSSILAQSSSDWRLVVVEDGDQGTGVATWLASLCDDKIHHVLNPSNLGVAGNFQRCLDLAVGEFVCFPGCDDRLDRDYIWKMRHAWTAHEDCAAVVPEVRVLDEHGQPVWTGVDWIKRRLRPRTPGVYFGEPLLTSLMHGNWTYFPATCWRVASIRPSGFRADLPTTLDLELLASLVLRGESIYVLDQQIFEYRRHSGSASSITASDGRRFQEERTLLDELALRASAKGWSRASRAARWRLTSRAHALSLIPSHMRTGGVKELFRHGVA